MHIYNIYDVNDAPRPFRPVGLGSDATGEGIDVFIIARARLKKSDVYGYFWDMFGRGLIAVMQPITHAGEFIAVTFDPGISGADADTAEKIIAMQETREICTDDFLNRLDTFGERRFISFDAYLDAVEDWPSEEKIAFRKAAKVKEYTDTYGCIIAVSIDEPAQEPECDE